MRPNYFAGGPSTRIWKADYLENAPLNFDQICRDRRGGRGVPPQILGGKSVDPIFGKLGVKEKLWGGPTPKPDAAGVRLSAQTVPPPIARVGFRTQHAGGYPQILGIFPKISQNRGVPKRGDSCSPNNATSCHFLNSVRQRTGAYVSILGLDRNSLGGLPPRKSQSRNVKNAIFAFFANFDGPPGPNRK